MRRISAALRGTVAVAGLILASLSSAAVLSWTGAELLTEPRANFPTQAPTLNGTSLLFGPSQMGFAKLITVDLTGLLTPNPQGQINFQTTIGLTRLPCIGASCAGGSQDWDAQLYLGDGINLFGGDLGDNAPGAYSEETTDAGDVIATPTGNLVFGTSQFPAIGESTELTLAFTLRPGNSNVTISAFGQSADFGPSFALDLTRPLALAFVRDNDNGEQYQVNFIQINYPNRAPEPGSAALLCGAAFALLVAGRARRTSRPFGREVVAGDA